MITQFATASGRAIRGDGLVDYRFANSGEWKINAGLARPESSFPFAASFHPGGVNVAFADGRAKFLSDEIEGHVYAAIFSPDSRPLNRVALRQPIISDDTF